MSKHLLPLIPPGLAVVQVLPTPECVTIVASPKTLTAACPRCHSASRRVHSRYDRRLGDLAWQGRPVVLRVQARRFRCLAPSCPQQTFAERLPGVAAVAARRTERLGGLHRCLGLALGGEAGRRLAERLAMPISADTLLRLACKAGNDNQPPSTPHVLAVDDWAWRKGQRYGTILVDLERNAVVDLLPDRQAETLAEWLRRHPGVGVVARDRAGAYADGVRQGAPDAVQVADRWHLLRNLGDAVRAVVDRQHAAVRRVARQVGEQRPTSTVAAAAQVPDSVKPTTAARRSQASRVRRQARYEDAARLRAAGASVSRIAAQLGADRKTIRGWLGAGGAPLWRKPPRAGVLAPWLGHLERRWAEGCHNAALLWRELGGLGYAGRYGTVRSWAGQQREADPPTAASHAGVGGGQPPSGRHLARLLMSDPTTLAEAEQAFVSSLLSQVPDLASAVAVAKRLTLLFRRKSKESLEAVLADAADTPLAEFAASLRRDLAAVQASLDLPWTTSPAEGQINRLKTLKRSMYGRAGFQLLRARVLAA